MQRTEPRKLSSDLHTCDLPHINKTKQNKIKDQVQGSTKEFSYMKNFAKYFLEKSYSSLFFQERCQARQHANSEKQRNSSSCRLGRKDWPLYEAKVSEHAAVARARQKLRLLMWEVAVRRRRRRTEN